MSSTTLSVEFFPPKDAAGEERLWAATDELRALNLDFISVTYGAGGSTRDRTVRITKAITERTSIDTVAHLTCVGSTQSEMKEILHQYKAAGIKSILALRGDPTGGPTAPWVSTPDGFDHADQLVQLAATTKDFTIGVAAFPDGHPANHGDFDKDIDVLLRKEELGATFATTQFFFAADRWVSLVERLSARGSQLPVIAGILPVTNIKQLKRMAELNGTPIPTHMENAFLKVGENPEDVAKLGIELATGFCEELLNAGVPGLHFFTMNTSHATIEVVKNLGLTSRAAQ